MRVRVTRLVASRLSRVPRMLLALGVVLLGCGGRIEVGSDAGVTPLSSSSDVDARPPATKLRCTEFHYFECDSRCFKLEPMDSGPDCFSSAGCGDMVGYMTFEQSGRVVQGGKSIATWTATDEGWLESVTRDGVTTKCVRIE